MKSEKPEDSGFVSPFIERVVNILTSLSEGLSTVSEISQHCGLNLSTTHRFLNILSQSGFIYYDSMNHKYFLGPLIGKLSSNDKATHQYLISSAYSVLKTLSSSSLETVTLSIFCDNRIIQLYEIPSKHDIRVVSSNEEIPTVFPMGAAQKTLVAQMTDENLDQFLRYLTAWSDKNNLGFNAETFLLQRDQILNLGFCVSVGERVKGGMCISAPVKNYYCPVAISILGIEERLKSRLQELIHLIRECADKLSNSLT